MRYLRLILMKFGTAVHIRPHNLMTNQKFEYLNTGIHNGRQWPAWKKKNHNISKTAWPISIKFCTMTY